MIRLIRPAPIFALASMLELNAPAFAVKNGLTPVALAARQSAMTRSWGMMAGEQCVACGGLYPHDDGSLEAWFANLPPASREMVSLIWQMRLTLSFIAETEHIRIFARVARGWAAGARIAKALKFHLETVVGGVEIWVL